VVAILEEFSSVSSLAQYCCRHDSGTISREILKVVSVICLSARHCASWLCSALKLLGNNNLAFVTIITTLIFEISFSAAGIMLASANDQKKKPN